MIQVCLIIFFKEVNCVQKTHRLSFKVKNSGKTENQMTARWTKVSLNYLPNLGTFPMGLDSKHEAPKLLFPWHYSVDSWQFMLIIFFVILEYILWCLILGH